MLFKSAWSLDLTFGGTSSIQTNNWEMRITLLASEWATN